MSKIDLTIIPHVVINPSTIVAYNEVIFESPRSKKHYDIEKTEPSDESSSSFLSSTRKNPGTLSLIAKRKLTKAIEYLVTTSNEKKVYERLTGKTVIMRVAFLTLTLPSKQAHSDAEIVNRCLNSFLDEIRKQHNVKHYVWRAELQKNGNIHFHILTDKFIPWYDARNRWNRIINKLNYVNKFQEQHGHRTPNSTDIHSTRKIKNLPKYLTKYMVKESQSSIENKEENMEDRRLTCHLWGCDHDLSKARGLNLIVDSEINEELKKVVDNHKVASFKASYYTIYYIDYHLLKAYNSTLLFKLFSDYLFETLQFTEQLKIAS